MPGYNDTGVILAGDVYLGDVDAQGNVTGPLRGPLNVPSLTLTPNTVETIERQSYKRDTYGQTLDAVNLPNDAANATIQFDSLPAIMLAEALAGTAATFEEPADSVTAEPVELVQGMWVKLPHSNIEGGTVVVTVDAAVVTDDCDIDLEAGLIRANTEAAAGAGTVDYSTLARSGSRVLGASEISKPRYILLQGENIATGQKVRAEIWRAVLNADQAQELMGREFLTGQLTGAMVTPEGKSSPYQVEILD